MPQLSNRVGTFTDSVIRRMTRISDAYGAINLSQGFPDFDPPKEIMDALAKAAYQGPHQYSVTYGAPNFRQALAKKQGKTINREIDPEKEIVVTCGGTEAMMCAMMTICNPGDKVMVFSPFYENYGADAILSGADPIYIPLIPPEYEFDINLIEQGFRDGAKAIIICNPSNPCGKVFREDELLAIGKLALKYDAFVVTDEVYEHMVYEPNKHICMASLPGMYEHTITCNSLSKTYSITGWSSTWVKSSSARNSTSSSADFHSSRDVSYIENPELFEKPSVIMEITSKETGYVKALEAKNLGIVSMKLGGGRMTKDEDVDHAVGLVLNKKIGDHVEIGETLLTVYARNKVSQEIIEEIYQSYTIVDEFVEKPILIEEIMK